MDFQKLNASWIYWLTIKVFFRNIFLFITIAGLNAGLGFVQTIVPLAGLVTVPASIFMMVVGFMAVHRTLLTGVTPTFGEAFEITPALKAYFWIFLAIFILPFIMVAAGSFTLVSGEKSLEEIQNSIIYLSIGGTAFYFLVLSFFGTSLTSTAIQADGMMMISRGKATFFYSLLRLLLLPGLVVVAIGAAVYVGFQNVSVDEAFQMVNTLVMKMIDSKVLMVSVIIGFQLFAILLNTLTATILTKAFLLAEVRIANMGEPSNWAKANFNIPDREQDYVYK